jgi:transposase InsO family protein
MCLLCIKIFIRYRAELGLEDGLLVRYYNNKVVTVVTIPLLIEIIYKTHISTAHIGRQKLVHLVQQHFWHPGLDEIARDICSSCRHCQLFKISSQLISPPTIKIQAEHPYDLVAMDLMQFPRSQQGYVAALVFVDHFSKQLNAIALKDKRAETVVRVLSERGLSAMIRIPDRILTDNGVEFKASVFEELLRSHNIQHVYSTRYRAQGNGAVGRCNRTITEFLKGIIDKDGDWAIKLPEAVIAYNNTYHVEIKDTPAGFLLRNAYKVGQRITIDSATLETWKMGHHRFAPFQLHQRVVLKVEKIGHQLKHKLGKKFVGPYEIIKVQPNNITYEIRDCKDGNAKIIKAHHKQLKVWTTTLFTQSVGQFQARN